MMIEAQAQNRNMFDQLSFAVIRSPALDEKGATSIAERLRVYGGRAIVDDYPSKNLDLQDVSHIISATADFPDYQAAESALIPVVRPQWVDDSVLKGRLSNTRQYNPDERYFMADVVICFGDIPEGDADAIAGGVLAMGGNFTSKVTSLTTHIVALSTDNEFCDIATQRNLPIKIVLPHWFDDCLRLGRKIDERPYLLPDPPILHEIQAKPPNGKSTSKQVAGALNPHPEDERPALLKRGPIKIFKNKTFMFSQDLGIGEHLKGILHDFIEGSDGLITEDVSKADYFVCKYRDGQDYKIASGRGIDVGNLAWLYYLITHDAWTSPYKRLLHYPLPRNGVPGFKGLKISLSNYSGEARTYLENLINATGAICTKTLRQENTHLVTAHDKSEKCAAARDWNVHMVNHLWLEESYARHQLLSVTVGRYCHFPQRTNLGEVVGRTPIDREVIERTFLTSDDDVEMAGAPAPHGTLSKEQQTSNPDPVAVKSKNVRVQHLNNHGALPKEDMHTPVTTRFAASGKENITPVTATSRKSKEVAFAKLHDLTPDIALYEKERKRVGGVIYGGRKKEENPQPKQSRKRTSDAADTDDSDDTESKRVKTSATPINMHLLISGYKRWIGRAKEEDADVKKLRELGIIVVTDPSRATHLAVPQIVRTPKVVISIAYAPVILSTNFIDACLSKDQFLKPEKFLLKDAETEKKLGTSLQKSRNRAKENKNNLLAGRSIYCVEKIHGGFETFKDIVEANGGQCMTYRGRNGTMVPSKRAGSENSTEDDPDNEVYLLSSDSKEDQRVWARFIKMAEGSRKVPRIVRSDWLLDSAMSQLIRATSTYELNVVS